MPKKTAKPEEAAPTAPHSHHIVAGGLPRFNFNAHPTRAEESMIDTTPMQQTYESVQQEAKGPGVEEVIAAISRGAAEKAWCTRWEVDDSLRWNHERQVWVAEDGFAFDGAPFAGVGGGNEHQR